MNRPLEPLGPPAAAKGRYAATGYRSYVLTLMFLVYVMTSLDRGIVNILVEPLKLDLGLSDGEVGLLIGPAFSFSFIFAGLPLGRLADGFSRRNLVAACLLAWSAMTASCGLAQGFLQLLLGRAAVGIGEAGGPPAAVSLISDLYPEATRTRAFAVFYAAAPIGVMVAFAGGAWVTGRYGWHAAFFAAAAPGGVLAFLIGLTVAEPARGVSEPTASAPAALSSRAVARFILGQRSLLHLMVAIGLVLLAGTGVMAFLGSFFVRSYGLSLPASGSIVSLSYGFGALAGAGVVGTLVNALLGKDSRYRYRIPAMAAALAGTALGAGLFLHSVRTTAVLVFLWSLLTVCVVVPSYSVFQSLVPVRARATMGAIQFMLSAIVGGLGPLAVGMVSDRIRFWAQAESLRYALVLLCLTYLWACVHVVLAGRTLHQDVERARGR